jgi:hypothetical protein
LFIIFFHGRLKPVGLIVVDARIQNTGTNTGDNIKYQKPLRSPELLQQRAENKQAKHITDQVPGATMKEHVGKKLEG